MTRRAHLAFLLHMHQPLYVDPRSGRAELPWVRLHGARAYLDVARLLEEHEQVRMTVNFVPSLAAQLEEVAAGAPDAWVELARKEEWSPEERVLLLERFFSVHWGHGVEPRARYRELLDKRGRDPKPGEIAERAAHFTVEELRDLTVLFFLSWLGFSARQGDHELAELETRGRGYRIEDLTLVLDRQARAVGRVLPLFRKLGERGQIELSASPYYHPIVPLLIDSEAAHRAQPGLPLPDHFSSRQDAKAQIERGAAAHARTFGVRPTGMWPPEGSVSPEALSVYKEAGVRWLATDEGNLWQSLRRAGRDNLPRGELYRAYRHAGVDLVFRDRDLSDRIGFSYAHGDSQAGAADLLGRVRAAADSSTAPADEPALVPIILDGENPWESYPGSGEPFLRALFSGLSHDPALRAVSVGEHLDLAPSRVELAGLHSGSWIDSDFHIWIGDPVKNRAWNLLGRARGRLASASAEGAQADKLVLATERLLAAEGSDWFWWFGEPFHSAEDALFDRLFRHHLAGAYAALGDPVPAELEQPVADDRAPAAPPLRPPYAFIHPRIGADGRSPSFYEWQGAARYEVPRGAAMADSPLIEVIQIGFDRSTLYLRLEPQSARRDDLAGATLEVELTVGPRRLRLRAGPDRWQLAEANGAGFSDLGSGGPVEWGRAVELAASFERLGLRAGDALELSFRLARDEVALARYPADGSLSINVPGDAFEVENWSV